MTDPNVLPRDSVDYRDIDPPCDHWDDLVGTVMAALPGELPAASVATCSACVIRSQGFVQLRTGIIASPLQLYPPK
ncbi:hypothetical protein [Nocardia fluminea]|uniref:hypothetical protein n=1 Tax=Nocardia fluminea TaxID=134984 RepID=UPI003D0DB54C